MDTWWKTDRYLSYGVLHNTDPVTLVIDELNRLIEEAEDGGLPMCNIRFAFDEHVAGRPDQARLSISGGGEP